MSTMGVVFLVWISLSYFVADSDWPLGMGDARLRRSRSGWALRFVWLVLWVMD
jgi:hypothetical protein